MTILPFLRNIAVKLLQIPFIYRIIGFLGRKKALIFYMHRIEDINLNVRGHNAGYLELALSFLQREGYQFVSLETIIQCLHKNQSLPNRAICFTLDDGFLDQATKAIPIFEKYNCPVTVFLISSFSDGTEWPWYEKIKYIFSTTKKYKIKLTINGLSVLYDLSNTSRMQCARESIELLKTLSEADFKEVLDQLYQAADIILPRFAPENVQPISWPLAASLESPLVAFAPHSASHPIFSRLTKERVREELEESWGALKKNLKNPLKVFCFPNGISSQDFTTRDVDITKKLGYFAVLTTDPGYVHKMQSDKYSLNRISFPKDMSGLIKVVTKADSFSIAMHRVINKPIAENYGGKKGMLYYYLGVLNNTLGNYSKLKEIDWKSVNRLIFICKGNICRSPYATAVANKNSFDTLSFGVDTSSDYPVNANAISVASENGINLRAHRTSRIESYIPMCGDLIIGMEEFHLEIFKKKVKNIENVQTTLLGLWGLEKSPYLHDPYGRGDAYFRRCFERIDTCLSAIFERL